MTGESRHGLLIPGGIETKRPACTAGTLFDLGEYPGLVLAGGERQTVYGELIRFSRLPDILPRLDEEEGSEYRRELLQPISNGRPAPIAWAYVLQAVPSAARVIESGDWRTR